MQLNDYMTTKQVMAHLNISRHGVALIAKNRQWNTKKIGSIRFYLREDVENTPLKRRGRPKKQKNIPLER